MTEPQPITESELEALIGAEVRVGLPQMSYSWQYQGRLTLGPVVEENYAQMYVTRECLYVAVRGVNRYVAQDIQHQLASYSSLVVAHAAIMAPLSKRTVVLRGGETLTVMSEPHRSQYPQSYVVGNLMPRPLDEENKMTRQTIFAMRMFHLANSGQTTQELAIMTIRARYPHYFDPLGQGRSSGG